MNKILLIIYIVVGVLAFLVIASIIYFSRLSPNYRIFTVAGKFKNYQTGNIILAQKYDSQKHFLKTDDLVIIKIKNDSGQSLSMGEIVKINQQNYVVKTNHGEITVKSDEEIWKVIRKVK